MSWFFSLLGKVSGNIAEVDSDNQVLVKTNRDPEKAGAALIFDSQGNDILVEENGALSVSQDELILSEQVDGAALNTNKWTTSVSTMAIAQSGGFITLNSGSSTVAGAYAILNSIMNIPLYGDMPVEVAFNAKVNVQPQSNVTIEIGIGAGAGTSAPTDGAFFRWAPTGSFQAVVNNAGSETTATCVGADCPPSSNSTKLFTIIITEDHVQFLINDEVVADIPNPQALAYPVSSGHQAILARVYNGGSAPSQAPQLSIGQILARQIAVNMDRPWHDVMAAQGMGAYQSPVTAFGQTANHANSTNPSSASLSNTAAGYTTLGGRFQFAAPAGAATDFALFAFQVPTPFKFYCTGVFISTGVTGAAIVTATLLDWSLGVNASNVSLATVDGAGTWAPRRIPLGVQGFIAGAGIGVMAGEISRRFDPPLLVDSNRFLHAILQIPNGAATGSLVFRGDVMLTGYFE